jgi:hypothetical protein
MGSDVPVAAHERVLWTRSGQSIVDFGHCRLLARGGRGSARLSSSEHRKRRVESPAASSDALVEAAEAKH